MRGRSRAAIAGLVAFGSLVLSAPAGAGIEENGYQGRAEDDSTTYVGFDLNDGKSKLKNFRARLKYHCPGQQDPIGIQVSAKGSLKVKNGKFAGKLDGDLENRGGIQRQSYAIKGKLRKHGKVEGTVDSVFFTAFARGDNLVRCYTGGLDWKVKKGAHVVVEVREDGDRR